MLKIVLLISISLLLTMSNVSNVHIFEDNDNNRQQQGNIIPVTTTSSTSDEISSVLSNADFGVWIHTIYNGVPNSIKLNIDLAQFTIMLSSLAWAYYDIDFEQQGDTRVGIQFSRTQIYVEGESNPYVNVFQTQFDFTTTCETDKAVEVYLEVRFPFSLLTKKSIVQSDQLDSPKRIISQQLEKILLTCSEKTHNKLFNIISEKLAGIHIQKDENNGNIQPMITNTEDYFCLRTGFSSPEGERLPGKILIRFFSGREKFYRSFSIGFEPAVELQITSILRELKLRYDFGRSAGVSTKISLQALGGALSNIVHHFTINPLPEHMSFDLTVLGERSFKYEADQRYSVTYTADSIQNDNLIKLDLENLPLMMSVEWGLDIGLVTLTGSGLIDVNMSSDIDEMSLSLLGSSTPFMRVSNFPKAIRLEAFVDVLNLNGYIQASKVSDATTTISVPLTFDKWSITGNLNMHNGYGQVSFNLPGRDGSRLSVGLDTDNNALFGLDFSVVDTQTNTQVLFASVGAIATDNFLLSADSSGGEISNLSVSGMITELTDVQIKIGYQGLNFEISGSWILREGGSFLLEVSKTINLTLDNIDAGDFILSGSVFVNPGGYVKVEWQRGLTGCFIFSTHGINAEASVAFGVKNSSNMYFYGNVELAPGAIVKFTWDWSVTGNFMVFCNLFEEIHVETYINYDPGQQEYQYGFRAHATDIMFTRTMKWDATGLRFWWLGDEPLPNQWDVWVLWNYDWHKVL